MKLFGILSLAVVLSLGAGASAQPICTAFGNDGFELGPCCGSPTSLNLPTSIPLISQNGKWGCFRDCGLEAESSVSVRLTFQWMALCDYGLMNVLALPSGAGAPQFQGYLFAKYSRTWTDFAYPGGPPRQVWRFLVNGDFPFGTVGPSPCPTPPCGATGQAVHMHGFVDYFCDPFTGVGYQFRMNLNHEVGCLSHAGFSSRPLVGPPSHDDRSYHLVSPDNFTFGYVTPTSGNLIGESLRASDLSWTPFNYQCRNEARIVGGSIADVQNPACFSCTSSSGFMPGAYHQQQLNGYTDCSATGVATPFSSLPIPGLFPGGMLAHPIGAWNTPFGNLRLTTYFGVMNYTDPCTGEGPFHVFAGAGVRYATPQVLFPTPSGLSLTAMDMIDLGNVRVLPPFDSYPWGSPYATSVVWQLAQ